MKHKSREQAAKTAHGLGEGSFYEKYGKNNEEGKVQNDMLGYGVNRAEQEH